MPPISWTLKRADHFTWFPYLVVILPVFMAMGLPPLRHSGNEWLHVFVATARELLAGKDIYNHHFEAGGYVYPPFAALVAVPFALMNNVAATVFWYAILCAAMLVMLRVAWDLSCSIQPANLTRQAWREHLIFLLGCAFAIKYMFNSLSHLQTDLIVGALVMLGYLFIARQRFYIGAISWSVSAAFKGPPLVMICYLIWKRRFAPAILMFALVVGANLLPETVHRSPTGQSWLAEWTHTYLHPLGREGNPGSWYAPSKGNQSIAGAVNRWFRLTATTGVEGGLAEHVRANAPSPRTLRLITLSADFGMLLPLCGLLFLASLRASHADSGLTPELDLLGCSCLMLLSLLLSPMSSGSHFGLMILPSFIVARRAVYIGDRLCIAILTVGIIASLVSFRLPFTRTLSDWANRYGAVMVDALLLFVGCLYLLGRDCLRVQ